MKVYYFTFVFALFLNFSAKAQLVTESYTKDFIFGSIPSRLVSFGQAVIPMEAEFTTINYVGNLVSMISEADDFLRSPSGVLDLSSGEEIGPSSLVQPRVPTIRNARVSLLSFSWNFRQPGNFFDQTMGSDPFKGQNEVILGFRLGKDELARYGWIRVYRKPMEGPPGSIEAATLKPFEPVDAALNPFPGRSIRAGMPPELPTLQTTPFDGGPEGPLIRVQWPAGYDGVRLQRTASLEAPVVWQDVPTEGHEVVVSAPDAGEAYFRLIYDF